MSTRHCHRYSSLSPRRQKKTLLRRLDLTSGMSVDENLKTKRTIITLHEVILVMTPSACGGSTSAALAVKKMAHAKKKMNERVYAIFRIILFMILMTGGAKK